MGRGSFILLLLINGRVTGFVPKLGFLALVKPLKSSGLIHDLDAVLTGREAISTLERLKSEGTVSLWNSAILTGDRRATIIDLRLATGIEGG